MRPDARLPLALLALSMLLLPSPAGAEPARELTFLAHGSGDDSWFTVAGHEGRNPVVPLTVGANVTLHFRNVGADAHNIGIDLPVNQATPCCFPPGGQVTFRFQVPGDAAGRMEYLCQAHQVRGMYGYFELPGPPDAPAQQAAPDGTRGPDADGRRQPVPALGALLVALAAAVRAIRGRAPPGAVAGL